MVQVSFDTKNDSIHELEEAMQLLQEAIARRKASESIEKDQTLQEPQEEEATLEVPFMKITVKSDDMPEPTLNQLLSDESITEEELTDMFDKHGPKETQEKKSKKPKKDETKNDEDEYIEIVEFEEESES